jgi:hypothetical protein
VFELKLIPRAFGGMISIGPVCATGLVCVLTSLVRAGLRLSNLSSTCVVGACKDRKCLCRDNGDGSSFCPGLKQTSFPFIDVDAGKRPNCETSEPETMKDSDGHEFFQGE